MSDTVTDRTSTPRHAIVPSGVLQSPEFCSLPASAIRVYLQIRQFAGCSAIFPSRTTLAVACRMIYAKGPRAGQANTDQVRKAIKALRDAGLLEVTPRHGPAGRQTSNEYALIDPPSFAGYDREGQPLFVHKLSTGESNLRGGGNQNGGGEGIKSDPLPDRSRGIKSDPPIRNTKKKERRGKKEARAPRGAWSGSSQQSTGGLAAWGES